MIERYRHEDELDGFFWYCKSCNNSLYKEFFELDDIVTQLPEVMNKFYSDEALRTCDSCGDILEVPSK